MFQTTNQLDIPSGPIGCLGPAWSIKRKTSVTAKCPEAESGKYCDSVLTDLATSGTGLLGDIA
jgi:hypothetical protein